MEMNLPQQQSILISLNDCIKHGLIREITAIHNFDKRIVSIVNFLSQYSYELIENVIELYCGLILTAGDLNRLTLDTIYVLLDKLEDACVCSKICPYNLIMSKHLSINLLKKIVKHNNIKNKNIIRSVFSSFNLNKDMLNYLIKINKNVIYFKDINQSGQSYYKLYFDIICENKYVTYEFIDRYIEYLRETDYFSHVLTLDNIYNLYNNWLSFHAIDRLLHEIDFTNASSIDIMKIKKNRRAGFAQYLSN